VADQILTDGQRQVLKERAAHTETWRDDADLDRRRNIGGEFQHTISQCGVLNGAALTDRCRQAIEFRFQEVNDRVASVPVESDVCEGPPLSDSGGV